MENDQITTNEIMEFLQEHMVTKQELKNELKDMVTKQELNKVKLDILDSMDEKISALKGDMTVMMRGEDKKLVALIDLLKNKKIIDEQEAHTLLSLHPFPQL